MVLFDLDGTLIDSSGVWAEIDREFLARRGLPCTRDYCEAVAHTIFPLAAQFTKEYGALQESPEEIMDEWRRMAYDAYSRTIPLKPHVREFLAQCRQQGLPMAIYTSGEPMLCEAVLRRHGLRDWFSSIIYARELGTEKYAPAAYAAVAERLGLAPKEITFFDDSPPACLGAAAAGWYVVGVYDALTNGENTAFRAACHRFIFDFGELMEQNGDLSDVSHFGDAAHSVP